MATLVHGSNIDLGNTNGIGEFVSKTLSSLALAIDMSHRVETADLSDPNAVQQIWAEYEASSKEYS